MSPRPPIGEATVCTPDKIGVPTWRGPGSHPAEPPQHISRPVSRVLYGAVLHKTRVNALLLAARDGHSSGTPVTRRLQQPTRTADRGHTIRTLPLARQSSRRPYSVLLPVGFAVPLPLPEARCALTAPFHPCVSLAGGRGLFSVALSLEFAALALGFFRRTLSGTACPWSPDFPLRPAFRHWTQAAVRPTDGIEVSAFPRESKQARPISLTIAAALRRSRGPQAHRRARDGNGAETP